MPATTPEQPRPSDGRPRPRPRPGDAAGRSEPPHRTPAPTRRPSRPPLAVAAAVAVGWAALLSYLPIALVLILAQVPGGTGTVGGAARTALAGWLLGHGVPLDTDAGPFRLAPLALALLAAWRVNRAGVHVTRAVGARRSRSAGRTLAVAGAVGIGYAVLGLLAALPVRAGGVDVAPLRAATILAVFGTLAAFTGAARATGLLDSLAGRTPMVLRDGVRTGAVAALLVLAAGAGGAGLAVAVGGGEASAMIAAYQTGVPGQAGITLISLGFAPNVAVWASSYLLGPGFAVGTETTVRTTEVTLGALPAVPLLAGLPNGPVDGLGAVLLAVPVLAGMVAGWLLARRVLRGADPDRTANRTQPGAPHPALAWSPLLVAAASGGPVAGVLLGLAAFASGGSLGGGRMAEIGPVAWQVAVVATVIVTVGTLLGAAGTRALSPP